ncbi:MAG: hypothetical protein ACI9VS_001616 [Candidatus Binatia bacterium]|jgi:hypothetical protein
MKIHSSAFFALALLSVTVAGSAQTPPTTADTQTSVVEKKTVIETRTVTTTATKVKKGTSKVAIIVENRAGREFNDKVLVLEDLLASRVAGKGFSVITREIVVNALNSYPTDGSVVRATPGQLVDRLLADNTSALRLAQNLGADYVLAPVITSYGVDKRTFAGSGIKTVNKTHNLRVSYKLAEGRAGGAVAGDTVKVSKTIRQSAGLQVENSDLLNELLDDAAGVLAESLVARQKTLPALMAKSDRVSLSVYCVATDFAELPNASLNENNEVVLGSGAARVSILNAIVELNGAVVGAAPGDFKARPGFNKLRVSREGFKPFERTINVYEGQRLTVPMQMSEGGYARWKDVVKFYVKNMENNRKLTDAEVKVMEGYAKMLSQSGYRINTTEGTKIYKSIY